MVRLGAEGDFSQLVERLELRQGAELFGKAAPLIDDKILSLLVSLGGVGAVILAAFWVRAKVSALPNASKMLASLSRYARLADFSEQLSFRHRFGAALGEVCSLLRTRTSPGLVILIDDLDRCPPESVAKVMEAISFCVGAGPCIVVMGMDRRQVEFAIGEGFKDIVEGLPDEELDLPSGESASARERQQAFARHYLEKLVNVEVPVPTLDDAGLRGLLRPDQATSPFEEGPRWLPAVRTAASMSLQVSRVMFLAVLLGLALTAGLEYVEHMPRQTAPPEQASRQTPAPAAPVESAAAPQPAPAQPANQPSTAPPMEVNLPIIPVDRDNVPGARQWLWWGPTAALLAMSLLWLVGLATRRRNTVVQDSPKFVRALDAVEPLLSARHLTPRLVKRFQNRMRYLAERMRTQQPDTDWVAGLLRRAGRITGNTFVPNSWFSDRDRALIPEDALILLGAVEIVAPDAFRGEASTFCDRLRKSLGDTSVTEGAGAARNAWKSTEDAFRQRDQQLDWPTDDQIRLYQEFVVPLLR